MSLTRQFALLLAAALTLSFVGAVGVNGLTLRDAASAELAEQNRQAALMLAAGADAAGTDPAAVDRLLLAAFAAGNLQRLRWTAPDGTEIWRRDRPSAARQAPAWFVWLWPLEPQPGLAPMGSRTGSSGTLELQRATGPAQDRLWAALARALAAWGLLAVGAAVLGAWGLRRIGARVQQQVEQCDALREGRLAEVAEPAIAELRPLARSTNRLVERLRQTFDVQAGQLDALRREAHADPLTGLAHRRHFLSRLEPELAAGGGPAHGGLLLLRLPDLEAMNRRIGHVTCDAALQAIGETLRTYEARVDGCFAGRLNGSDFALWLPAGNLVADTAQATMAALKPLLQPVDPASRLVAAAIHVHRPTTGSVALAAADEALARAELRPGYGVEVADAGAQVSGAIGEGDWQRGIEAALAGGRVALGRFAVRDAAGALLHLDCPLRVQLVPDGAMEPATRWLALAVRSRLTALVDERAVGLALGAIAADGVPRCVNLAQASLRSVGFVTAMSRLLERHAAQAGSLWLDLPETVLARPGGEWRDVVQPWRAAGVRVGLEHAGEQAAALGQLGGPSLDYLRVDARFVAGAGTEGDARRYLQGLVALARGMGLRVFAEGVRDGADLAALWPLGFDGATGPAVAEN